MPRMSFSEPMPVDADWAAAGVEADVEDEAAGTAGELEMVDDDAGEAGEAETEAKARPAPTRSGTRRVNDGIERDEDGESRLRLV